MSLPAFSARKKNKHYMLLLLSHPPFQSDVVRIRKDIGVPEKAFEIGSEQVVQWEQTWTRTKRVGFAEAMRQIISDYNLPENFAEYIKAHIIYGSEAAPLNNFAITPFSRDTDPSESRHATVHIYAKLTQKEEKDLKRELNRLAKNLPSFKPLQDIEKRLEREKRALEARKFNATRSKRDARMSYGEILGDKRGARKEAKKASEDIRGMKDIRTKRFGKK